MSALACTFPTLARADGVRPFDAEVLDAWAAGPVPGSGPLHAARFLLALWNNHARWRAGRFDAVEALCAWDRDHREAFLRWAERPWWP